MCIEYWNWVGAKQCQWLATLGSRRLPPSRVPSQSRAGFGTHKLGDKLCAALERQLVHFGLVLLGRFGCHFCGCCFALWSRGWLFVGESEAGVGGLEKLPTLFTLRRRVHSMLSGVARVVCAHFACSASNTGMAKLQLL